MYQADPAILETRFNTAVAAYDTYAPHVARVKEDLGQLETYAEHPYYLGSGRSATAFVLSRCTNGPVVRMDSPSAQQDFKLNSYVDGLLLGQGLPHMEQLVAVSEKDNVTISERLPGKPLDDLTLDTMMAATDQQLTGLVDVIDTANAHGIALDATEGNILYHPLEGFGFIDYGKTAQPLDRFREFAYFAIQNMLMDYDVDCRTAEAFAHERERVAQRLLLVDRFEQACHQQLPAKTVGSLSFVALKSGLERQLADYGNRDWVAHQLSFWS